MSQLARDRVTGTASIEPIRPAAVAKPRRRVRLVSLFILMGVLAGVALAGRATYHALSDSYVAPIILSPDADVVIQQKLNLSRVVSERNALLARIAEGKSTAEAAARAKQELQQLQSSLQHALDWATDVSARQQAHGVDELSTLRRQQRVIADMIGQQEAYAAELRKNVDAGLVRKDDLQRESAVLSQLKVSALQNERDQKAAQLQLDMAEQAGRALGTAKKGARKSLLTPEMQTQREQLVRLTVDMLKYEAEERLKRAQLQSDEEALAKLDELLGQMKQRPIFRAIQSSQNVAFVPYTQIAGVDRNAKVFNCSLWGVFFCEQVGVVAEVLPGEVVTQDPWGSPARGQYAILALSDSTAAQAKVLRIRDVSRTAQASVAVIH